MNPQKYYIMPYNNQMNTQTAQTATDNQGMSSSQPLTPMDSPNLPPLKQ
jgi:hypothetical protein